MTPVEQSHTGQRGGPLLMLMMLVVGWVAVRVLWWDDPFASPAAALPGPPPAYLYAPQSVADPYLMAAAPVYPAGAIYGPGTPGAPLPPQIVRILQTVRSPGFAAPYRYEREPDLGLPAFPTLPPGAVRAQAAYTASAAPEPGQAPFLPAARPAAAPAAAVRRWSLDYWTFYRQGSSEAAPVSQGRVPVYGANQAGGVLQYRLARSSRHDPRLYLRAYSALVPGGESELALGASMRPMARVPVRVAAEARYTETVFGSQIRPAAYAVTELSPIALPMRTRLEAYGQAGWVGGAGATPFADGQAVVTRDLPFVGRLSRDALRMSFGAGAWGGAQNDAQRLDIGPTMRFDVRIGKVPARVSVDWRQRVAGAAEPGSGVAATISAGF